MEISHQQNSKKVAVIIGGGPAGLTAAYELLKTTKVHPVIVEADPKYVGGISKTVEYKGNRIDIGGHRFFSKSDTVMDWWLQILPVDSQEDALVTYQGKGRMVSGSEHADNSQDVMLLRKRVSRIYYNKTFFPYPIELNIDTIRKLGIIKVCKFGCTYIYRVIVPRRPEKSLEDFFINRFGDELYKTFFKSYTEKVWGMPCSELSAEWGAQRIKGLSITKAVVNALAKPFRKKDLKQKSTETSLIEQFLYPKFGPGHLWEVVADTVKKKGGEIHMGTRAVELKMTDGKVTAVVVKDPDGNLSTLTADYVFSTTSVKELAQAMKDYVPSDVARIAGSLEYRDFITVGVLIKKEDLVEGIAELDDNWIYIHEPNVLVGRVQIFNNWSPYLVADEAYLWCGLEYFCTEGDDLWKRSDEDLKKLAVTELVSIGFVQKGVVTDATVLREKKTYPTYAGAYEKFDVVQQYLDSVPNLFPVGRNGMHRYNNQDHSMLTAIAAVDLVKNGSTDKSKLWEINVEQEYHEEKSESKSD